MKKQLYKIGQLCDVKTGKLDANASSENGVYPFFTCSKDPLRINSYSYDAECVLIAGNGDLNVKYYNGKFDAYQRTYIVTLKKNIKNITVHYLYTFFSLYIDILRQKSIGGVIKYIKLGDITEALIPVPPIEEQQRIVTELDLLSSIIEKQKAQLKELDTLAQSIFYDMFGDPVTNEKGWKTKKIGDIASVKTGPFGSMLHKQDYINGGTPLINPIHIKNYSIEADNEFSITREKVKELEIYLLKENDVILARRGDIGRCAVIRKDEEGYLCGTGCLFVRFLETVLPIYILYTIKEESFKRNLISKAKGATMLNINSEIVSDLLFALPPLSLQQQFADKIQSIESQKSAITKSIAETQKLFDYTMDKYFG